MRHGLADLTAHVFLDCYNQYQGSEMIIYICQLVSAIAAAQILGGEGRGIYVLMSGLDIERGAGAAGPLG